MWRLISVIRKSTIYYFLIHYYLIALDDENYRTGLTFNGENKFKIYQDSVSNNLDE